MLTTVEFPIHWKSPGILVMPLENFYNQQSNFCM